MRDGLPPSVRLLSIGFYIATCIILGLLGGSLLDGVLDTGKVFAVAGLFVGLAMALFGAYQQLMEVLGDIERRRKAGK